MPNTLRSLAQRALVLLALGGLLAAGLFVGAAPTPANAATYTVTGTVFRDFDGDNVFDTGHTAQSGIANDVGVAGVTVTAVDAAGTSWSTTTVAPSGSYSLATTDPLNNKLRVTFATPSPYQPSAHGVANGTSVQFVDVTSGSAIANYTVNAPEDYAQANPPIVTAIQYSGLRTSDSIENSPTLAAIPWSAQYTLANEPTWDNPFPSRTTLATVLQTGSIWGTAYDTVSDSMFAAATYKRHADLGPLGLGGIYRVSDVLTPAGAINPAATTTPWLDVTTLGIDVGTVAATRDLGLPQDPSHDDDAFANAAKVGIGGLAVDPATHTLYFVNLFDKEVYSVDLNSPTGSVHSTSLGLTDEQRPWAIEVHHGKLYVGYIESGESTPWESAADRSLEYSVVSTPLATLGPATPWTQVLYGPLGYTRGSVAPMGSAEPQTLRWNAWVDAWGTDDPSTPLVVEHAPPSVAPASASWGAIQLYPQPILTDLSFDTENFMVLAIADRTELQAGNRNYGTGTDTVLYQAVSSGDLLIASPNANGTFTPEANGSAGARGTAGVAAEGPSGKEFFNDRHALGGGTYHRENTLGSAATLAGVGTTAVTSYDPLSAVRVAGVNWFQLSNGAVVTGYQHNKDSGDASNRANLATGTFQKAGGLGDIDALALAAPLEIGNRVWFDADQDGQQDADEPGVANVTVALLQGASTIATMSTTSTGEYYFSSTTIPAFQPNGGAYTVRFTTPSSGAPLASDPRFATLDWSNVRFTTPNLGSDTTDSDAVAGTQHIGTIAYSAGGAGMNDHSLDAGLAAEGAFTVHKTLAGSGSVFVAGIGPYTVEYTTDPVNGPWTAMTVANGGITSALTLPYGTPITIRELPRPIIAGINWGDPVWTGTGVTTNGDHTATFTIEDGTTIGLGLENPVWATPHVTIQKGDGEEGVIVHDADTMPDGEHYEPGETRTIVVEVTNDGTEDLVDVELSDETFSGAEVEGLSWTFPDGSTADAGYVGGEWFAEWENTFDGTSVWAPDAVIWGEATLTIEYDEDSHLDRVGVAAVGAYSGTPVGDSDDYNAFTGEIQVIKYDGRMAGPAVQSGGDWVVPAKPLANLFQDANDLPHAAQSIANVPVRIEWVVSNAGATTLTDLMVSDTTLDGPAIGAWSCDLSEFGGPDGYSFTADGPWTGFLPPKASFFCSGTVTLQGGQWHTDRADVTAHVVVPAVDNAGIPTGEPSFDVNELPVLALDEDNEPVVVDDDDPFLDPAALPELALTGVDSWMPWAAGFAVLSVLIGLLAVALPRRRRSEARHR